MAEKLVPHSKSQFLEYIAEVPQELDAALHRAAQCRQTEACKLLINEERFTAINAVDDQGADLQREHVALHVAPQRVNSGDCFWICWGFFRQHTYFM